MSEKYNAEILPIGEAISEIEIKEGDETICQISMKWDGCLDVRMPYVHFCGEDDFNDFVSFVKQELLNLAEIMNSEY